MWTGLRAALRGLWRDDWVIGIACAAALAVAGVDTLRAAARLGLSVIDQPDLPDHFEGFYVGPYTFKLAGRVLQLEELLTSALTMLGVVILAAIVLRGVRRGDGPEVPGDS